MPIDTDKRQRRSSELTLDEAIIAAREWQKNGEAVIPYEIITVLLEFAEAHNVPATVTAEGVEDRATRDLNKSLAHLAQITWNLILGETAQGSDRTSAEIIEEAFNCAGEGSDGRKKWDKSTDLLYRCQLCFCGISFSGK